MAFDPNMSELYTSATELRGNSIDAGMSNETRNFVICASIYWILFTFPTFIPFINT